MNDYYNEYANDDLRFKDADDPTVVLLRDLGWPELSELLNQNPKIAAKFIQSMVDYDSLQGIFPKTAAEVANAHYHINSVDQVEIRDGLVCLRGIALESTAKR